jgi:hypothetical protein
MRRRLRVRRHPSRNTRFRRKMLPRPEDRGEREQPHHKNGKQCVGNTNSEGCERPVGVASDTALAGDLPSYRSMLREETSLRGAAAGTGTLERASEFLQDRSKDKGVGSERTAAAGCRSGIFADHVSPIVNGHIYFDPVELGRSPPDPVRVLLQGGHIAIAVRKNSVLRLLLGKAVGAFIGRGCITLSSVEQACLTVTHKIGLGEFSVRDRPITHTYRSKISGAPSSKVRKPSLFVSATAHAAAQSRLLMASTEHPISMKRSVTTDSNTRTVSEFRCCASGDCAIPREALGWHLRR